MPMTALCDAAALCRGATTVRVAAHETSGGKLLAVWIAQSACSCSRMRNSWQSRPRHVQQCVPHNQPTPCMRCSIRSTQSAAGSAGATVWIATSFRPRPCVLSTPSHADAAEFSSTPSHAALLRGTARQHRTGPSWASNDAPLKDLSNTRALKHLTPLATDYWAASHSFVEPGHSCFRSKFEKIVSVSKFLAGRMQWGRAAAGMETVGPPSNSKCDSVKG